MNDSLIPHEYVPNRGDSRTELSEGEGDRCLECGEVQVHSYHVAMLREVEVVEERAPFDPSKGSWAGDTPFYLVYRPPVEAAGNTGIDLDESGWVEANKVIMRSAGTWLLVAKRTNTALFTVLTSEGDQFYYAKRHVGDLMRGREALCYGIGKKQADGRFVNLWLLPNGTVCGGEDVDELAAGMIG